MIRIKASMTRDVVLVTFFKWLVVGWRYKIGREVPTFKRMRVPLCCFYHHVARLLSPISRLLSHVSRLPTGPLSFPASRLSSPQALLYLIPSLSSLVSCLSSPISRPVSRHPSLLSFFPLPTTPSETQVAGAEGGVLATWKFFFTAEYLRQGINY